LGSQYNTDTILPDANIPSLIKIFKCQKNELANKNFKCNSFMEALGFYVYKDLKNFKVNLDLSKPLPSPTGFVIRLGGTFPSEIRR
jgi:hypothetical protein